MLKSLSHAPALSLGLSPDQRWIRLGSRDDTAIQERTPKVPARRRLVPALVVSLSVHAVLIAAAVATRLCLAPADEVARVADGNQLPAVGGLKVTIEWPGGDAAGQPAAAAALGQPVLSRPAPPLAGMAGMARVARPQALGEVVVVDELSDTARRLREATLDHLAAGSLTPRDDRADADAAGGSAAGGFVGAIDATGTGLGGGGGDGAASWGVGHGRGLPAHLANPVPPYPRLARERGWQGTTVLNVEVRQDGHGGEVRVAQTSGYALLDASSVETVRKWRFLPARSQGRAVTSWVRIPVRFELKDS